MRVVNTPLPLRRLLALAVAMGIVAASPAGTVAEPATPRLSFDVIEGLNINSFLREGPVAAHLVLRSGLDPRILVAFPAGNSGVGLWFSPGSKPTIWTLIGRPQPILLADSHGRPLYGMIAEVSASGAQRLSFAKAVLSSVRVLRDFQSDGRLPLEIGAEPTLSGSTITWARDRLDGAAGYRLSVRVIEGGLDPAGITATGGQAIRLQFTAVTGETPLTPLSEGHLLNAAAKQDVAARNALAFLSYRESFLAGSWRFNTYFGRDTLMSVRLLMPVLMPEAIDAGLGAVLTRLSPAGEVAHEEDLGEFAILDHRQRGENSAAPTFDYKMIDGTFLLAPIAAAWLLDDARGRAEARQFLGRTDHRDDPRAQGADLARNLRFVLDAAARFADAPRATNLIALKPGTAVGQWRDSNDGLAGGRFAYDVNAVFVPAALDAAARFYRRGLLDPFLDPADRHLFARAATMAGIWRAKAGPLFNIHVPNATARTSIKSYAAALGVPDGAALRAVAGDALSFHALALAADGTPIPVLNSDEGFALLFSRPGSQALTQAVSAFTRPFPAGLLTPVGVVVANPVFATPAIQAVMTRSAYHGTVIWSWQQAVLAAGIQRQLNRKDLGPTLIRQMRDAQRQLWEAIRAAHAVRNSELWSWTYANGHFQIAPFGAAAADADESNAAQLWSTVFLSIPDPVGSSPPAPLRLSRYGQAVAN
ncbi:MAG: lipoprotein [Steroidobacteraceae bacterium]